MASHSVEYLEANALLSDIQFDFRKSTEDQLLSTYGDISQLIDLRMLVDLVRLGFSKTFDIACHSVLLSTTWLLVFPTPVSEGSSHFW